MLAQFGELLWPHVAAFVAGSWTVDCFAKILWPATEVERGLKTFCSLSCDELAAQLACWVEKCLLTSGLFYFSLRTFWAELMVHRPVLALRLYFARVFIFLAKETKSSLFHSVFPIATRSSVCFSRLCLFLLVNYLKPFGAWADLRVYSRVSSFLRLYWFFQPDDDISATTTMLTCCCLAGVRFTKFILV